MEAIQIKNLRSLGDTGRIQLRPLTLLLGANSTGKSTFVRTFPLFRQSIETRTTGPVLWYGHLVDFGSFSDAVRIGSSDESISFVFCINTPTMPDPKSFEARYMGGMPRPALTSFPVELQLILRSSARATYTAGYVLKFLDDEVYINFDSEGRCIGARVNSSDFTEKVKSYTLISVGQIFQQIGSVDETDRNLAFASRRFLRGPYVDSFESILLRQCSSYFDGRTSQDRRFLALRSMSIGTAGDMFSQLLRMPNRDEKWTRRLSGVKVDSDEFRSLRNTILLARIPRLLMYADQYLVSFFSQSRYVAPLRATAERFYRSQNLAVDEVDARGSNLTMFLGSLSTSAQQEFEQWTMEELGFSVKAHLEGAHVTLRLQIRGSKRSLNLADLGFGFSQILPVVAQIWHSRRKRAVAKHEAARVLSPPRIIVIEQLELHLHPAMQALVVDLIARVIAFGKSENATFLFVIETHSETIVNRVGQLIAGGVIAAADAQTLIFEKKPESDESTIRHANYTDKGTLENWPYGFFLPEPPPRHVATD